MAVPRRAPLLPRWVWCHLAVTFAPVVVWVVVLKTRRVLHASPSTSPWSFVDQVRSDVAWPVGLLLLTAAVVVVARATAARVAARTGRPRLLGALATWPALVCAQLVAVATGVFAELNTVFIASTGSNLGLGRIRQYVDNYAELNGVVMQEMDPALPTKLTVTAVVLLVSAPLLTLGEVRLERWLRRRGTHPTGPRRRRGRAAALGRLTLVAACAAGLLFSATVPALSSPAYLSRDGVVNLGLGELADLRYAATAPPAADPAPAPTQTYLRPTRTTEKRNVVMIFMESVRASATTMFTPGLRTTPYLNSLKNRSIFAEHAYAVVPHTSKALTAATCGIEPPLDTTNSEADASGLPARCLPQLLGDAGYDTAFFQSATYKFERRPELVHNFGYEQFTPEEDMDHRGFSEVNYFGYEDDIQLAPTREFLAAHRRTPFLATYLTVTTHHDYRMPADYPLQHFSDDPAENSYLNGVRYTDRFIEKLMGEYKKAGLYDDTVFVITGDHGEGFGEHGLLEHDNTIYDEGTHIPYMIIDPQAGAKGRPRTIRTPVQTTTVLPTVADLLGYDIGGGAYPAPSLLSGRLTGRLRISCFLQSECMALVDGDKKYIYHYGNRPDEFFDLRTDPLERHNLIKSQPRALIGQLRAELLAWPKQNAALYDQREPPTTLRTPGPR